MSTLYVVKDCGRYHFFKTEELRENYIKAIPDWQAKHCLTYEVRYGKLV